MQKNPVKFTCRLSQARAINDEVNKEEWALVIEHSPSRMFANWHTISFKRFLDVPNGQLN
jgi:hypothetical protein